MNIEIGVGIGNGGLSQVQTDRLLAYAWASAGNPSVSASSDLKVNGVVANSNISTIPPSLSNSDNISVLAVLVNVTSGALNPAILAVRNNSVYTGVANSNADIIPPIVSNNLNASVLAVVTGGNANILIPVVSTVRNASVIAVVAGGVASAGVPNVSVSGTSTILVQHTFTAANSTTNIPNADTDQMTEVLLGMFGIRNNRAYQNYAGTALAVWQSGQSDVQVSSDIILNSGSIYYAGLAFRISDSNNYFMFRRLSGNYQLYRVQAGSATLLGSVAISPAVSVGTVKFKIIANGSDIKCYVNDILQLATTDAFNQTATKHGLRQHITADEDYDNFLIETI